MIVVLHTRMDVRTFSSNKAGPTIIDMYVYIYIYIYDPKIASINPLKLGRVY